MRLEPLCEMRLAYQEDPITGSKFMLARPFGTEEGMGYGGGDGTVTGEKLSGKVSWINHPHRRSDGTMLPNVYGVIVTDDGTPVLFTLEGRAYFAAGAIIGDQMFLVRFTVEDARYRWLNDGFFVLEGVYSMQTMDMAMRIFTCINDLYPNA